MRGATGSRDDHLDAVARRRLTESILEEYAERLTDPEAGVYGATFSARGNEIFASVLDQLKVGQQRIAELESAREAARTDDGAHHD